MNYQPKQIIFDKDAQAKLISGIEKLSNAVKSTLGPRGKTVLIESLSLTNQMTVTKDGATVAKHVELLDAVENLACKMLKATAQMTAENVGDGTSTSIVLAEALIKESIQAFKANPEANQTMVLRRLNYLSEQFCELLKKEVVEVTPEFAKAIATVSANNDEETGKMVASVFQRTGENGIVLYEKSKNLETYSEVIEGIKLEAGYTSPAFMNNTDAEEWAMEGDCYVLVTDMEIDNFVTQLNEQFLQAIISKKVLFIAPFKTNALHTLLHNVKAKSLDWCVVSPPYLGLRQKEILGDVALKLCATFFSSEFGSDLSLINFEDLGEASKIKVQHNRTIIVPDVKEVPKKQDIDEESSKLISELQARYPKSKPARQKLIQERISILSGKVGIIYAGGSDMAQKELYDRIEDAVHAVRAAIDGGVLIGAGVPLYNFYKSDVAYSKGDEGEIAYNILSKALKVPLRQILINAGLDKKYAKENPVGYLWVNSKTGTKCNLLDAKIVDPYKVTVSALRNAVEVATTILSTNAVITLARDIEKGGEA